MARRIPLNIPRLDVIKSFPLQHYLLEERAKNHREPGQVSMMVESGMLSFAKKHCTE